MNIIALVLGLPVQELDRLPVQKPGRSGGRLIPSATGKTAARLHDIDIHTVEPLLDSIAKDATRMLGQRWITQDVFQRWQQFTEPQRTLWVA